jgi:hypothetical protein
MLKRLIEVALPLKEEDRKRRIGNEECCIRRAASAWDPARLYLGPPDTTFLISASFYPTRVRISQISRGLVSWSHPSSSVAVSASVL